MCSIYKVTAKDKQLIVTGLTAVQGAILCHHLNDKPVNGSLFVWLEDVE